MLDFSKVALIFELLAKFAIQTVCPAVRIDLFFSHFLQTIVIAEREELFQNDNFKLDNAEREQKGNGQASRGNLKQNDSAIFQTPKSHSPSSLFVSEFTLSLGVALRFSRVRRSDDL